LGDDANALFPLLSGKRRLSAGLCAGFFNNVRHFLDVFLFSTKEKIL
jgi:hypothetical protein